MLAKIPQIAVEKLFKSIKFFIILAVLRQSE